MDLAGGLLLLQEKGWDEALKMRPKNKQIIFINSIKTKKKCNNFR
jgi:hypothetical protein